MELVKYKQKNGHCNFPTKKNGSLGHWINRQREVFRSKKLNGDRYKKLVGIGSHLRMRDPRKKRHGIYASWSL
eukprot:scaffold1964_cov172-Chaetoceros_neogracile.AAC.1